MDVEMAGPASAVVRRVGADARTRTLSFSVLFFAVVAANAIGYRDSYPDIADRMKLVAAFADNKAARIFYGAGRDLVGNAAQLLRRNGQRRRLTVGRACRRIDDASLGARLPLPQRSIQLFVRNHPRSLTPREPRGPSVNE